MNAAWHVPGGGILYNTKPHEIIKYHNTHTLRVEHTVLKMVLVHLCGRVTLCTVLGRLISSCLWDLLLLVPDSAPLVFFVLFLGVLAGRVGAGGRKRGEFVPQLGLRRDLQRDLGSERLCVRFWNKKRRRRKTDLRSSRKDRSQCLSLEPLRSSDNPLM